MKHWPASRGRLSAARLTLVICLLVVIVAAAAAFALSGRPVRDREVLLAPKSILGVFAPGVPDSFSPLNAFTASTGVRPNVDLYYSGWNERFQTRFARQAAEHGAVPFVEIDPTDVPLSSIAAGRSDNYLRGYAASVRAFHRRIILGFGHEMNGWWYSWGSRHTSPAAFVAAWRHVVTVFRQQGAANVTWMWTVNIIDTKDGIPSPAAWWPGRSYVTWIGIDGYYDKSTWTFASLFGPTIKVVRALNPGPVPILIAETGATQAAGQVASIAGLFRGVRSFGLLGFVWFDARAWRLDNPEAIAAFRRGVRSSGPKS